LTVSANAQQTSTLDASMTARMSGLPQSISNLDQKYPDIIGISRKMYFSITADTSAYHQNVLALII
jgi:hypothetical protein